MKKKFDPSAPSAAEPSLPEGRAATARPRVLVVGPGPAQLGGVTTFIRILMSSGLVAEKYELIRLDTTRAAEDVASAGRFSLRNLSYLLSQIWQLVLIAARQRPVVMHLAVTSGWSFWKGSAFFLIAKVSRMRIVAHLHGGDFREFYRKHPSLFRNLIGWVLKRADLVIALSRQWQRFLLDEVRPDLRVMILPNTVDNQFAAAAAQNDYASRQSGNVVLFVGHLDRAKGMFDILRAVPLVLAARDDTIFLFAGRTTEAQNLEDLQCCVAKANLGKVVQFLGEVTGQAKLDLFRRATLFILPSYVEGLPFVLLEAMAVGLPVITTPVGAIPEIIKEGQHGFLIQPGDFAALAQRIIQLLGNESLAQRMSLANRYLIRDHYLPDVAMTRLVAIYDRLQGPGAAEVSPSPWDEEKEETGSSRGKFQAPSSRELNDEPKEEAHAT